jgi:hypothetical protein
MKGKFVGILVASVLVIPGVASASTLTAPQVRAIIGLLQAFDVSQSVITEVYADIAPTASTTVAVATSTPEANTWAPQATTTPHTWTQPVTDPTSAPTTQAPLATGYYQQIVNLSGQTSDVYVPPGLSGAQIQTPPLNCTIGTSTSPTTGHTILVWTVSGGLGGTGVPVGITTTAALTNSAYPYTLKESLAQLSTNLNDIPGNNPTVTTPSTITLTFVEGDYNGNQPAPAVCSIVVSQ